MAKQKLFVVTETEIDGQVFRYIQPESKVLYWGSQDSALPDNEAEKFFTLEKLSAFCDRDAESCNAHDFVGAHRVLAGLLLRSEGREHATRIMREIAEYGGIHSMNGICGRDGAFDELKVPEREPEGDWTFESFGTTAL